LKRAGELGKHSQPRLVIRNSSLQDRLNEASEKLISRSHDILEAVPIERSEELGVRVMEIRKRVLGEEHSITANLAATYSNPDRWKEAEELLV
jgi:hypothetical protein